MNDPAPTTPSLLGGRYSAERYLRPVAEGVLGSDDRAEPLCGVVVGMAPQNSATATPTAPPAATAPARSPAAASASR